MIQQTYTGGQFLFSFLLMNIIFFGAYECFQRKRNYIALWIGIFLFCVFSFWNQDFFSFQYIFYKELDLTFRDPFYYYIKQISFDSYYLFRAIIWGAALGMFYKTVKEFGIKLWVVSFVFPVFFLLTFSYARASLAMACYFWGITLLLKPKSVLSYIESPIFLALSYFAHRSMLPLILFTPLVSMKLNFKSKSQIMIAVSLLSLVVYSFIFQMKNGGLELYSSNFSLTVDKYLREGYGEQERNLKSLVMGYLHIGSIYLLYLFVLFKYINNKKRKLEMLINKMIIVSTFLVVVSLVFYVMHVVMGITNTIAFRYLYISYIPLILLISYYFQKGLCKKSALYYLMIPSLLYAEGLIGGILYSRFL